MSKYDDYYMRETVTDVGVALGNVSNYLGANPNLPEKKLEKIAKTLEEIEGTLNALCGDDE